MWFPVMLLAVALEQQKLLLLRLLLLLLLRFLWPGEAAAAVKAASNES